ncbi:lipopolysaccharide transport periplasmic protein LptA [Psychrobium sp. 1_MG-2023]|uniref:lipopolysaccharide transport periplasmic protein LptA n=1 Tax=Psychrobium sp. 1_MG-2023 TaxID=3062624 RepID=UPI00267864FE|nr:lipopolysaccharide transport periplasmic protein LptA [Psychrobium sp. 1_MG-2023]MDP2560703.1 lipopolysaccharide transport periplasmic protein LptA [Psychrobium sp. 1_MG-2023]
MKTLKASAFFLLALLTSNTATALSDDFKQQASINADNQYIDLAKNIAVYKGNVTIKQGSIEITADRLEVYNHGEHGVELMVLIGRPARFSQRVGDGNNISAQAKEIRFERGTNIIKLNRSAQLTWGKNVVKGDTISYDMVRQLLNADRNANKKDQVTTILQPNESKN